MYSKYKEEFIEELQDKDKYIYFTCYDLANALNKPVNEWADEDLDTLLASMESISANSIRKYIAVFREIQEYLGKKVNVQYQRFQPTKPVFEYISFQKLRSRILTYDDCIRIRTLLTHIDKGKEYNFRDKVMFELAWEGLSNSEIRFLKEADIEWIKGINENDIKAKLRLPDNREMIIDDEVVVKDLIAAVNERIYARVDKNGKMLVYPYRFSKYLIKPIAITNKIKNIDDESVSNPSLMLKQIMSKIILGQEFISKNAKGGENVLDLENLNLEDIRRSKIIYMLALNKYLSVGDIAKTFGKSVVCDYYWLKEVSTRVYM